MRYKPFLKSREYLFHNPLDTPCIQVKQIKWAEDIKNRCFKTIEVGMEICKKERLAFQPDAEDFQREFKAWEILKTDMENLFAHDKCQDASFIIERRDMLTGEQMLELHRMKVKELEEA